MPKVTDCYCEEGWYQHPHNGDWHTCSCPLGLKVDHLRDFVDFVKKLMKSRRRW